MHSRFCAANSFMRLTRSVSFASVDNICHHSLCILANCAHNLSTQTRGKKLRHQPPLAPPPPLLPPPKPPNPPPPPPPPELPPNPPPPPSMPPIMGPIHQPLPLPPRPDPPLETALMMLITTKMKMRMGQIGKEEELLSRCRTGRGGAAAVRVTPRSSAIYLASCQAAASMPAP